MQGAHMAKSDAKADKKAAKKPGKKPESMREYELRRSKEKAAADTKRYEGKGC
jgi:hypothetical protein